MNSANENGKRHIYCNWPKYKDNKDLRIDIFLEETALYSMVIATPWKRKGISVLLMATSI